MRRCLGRPHRNLPWVERRGGACVRGHLRAWAREGSIAGQPFDDDRLRRRVHWTIHGGKKGIAGGRRREGLVARHSCPRNRGNGMYGRRDRAAPAEYGGGTSRTLRSCRPYPHARGDRKEQAGRRPRVPSERSHPEERLGRVCGPDAEDRDSAGRGLGRWDPRNSDTERNCVGRPFEARYRVGRGAVAPFPASPARGLGGNGLPTRQR